MVSTVDVMVYDFMNCKKNSYPHLALENMGIFKNNNNTRFPGMLGSQLSMNIKVYSILLVGEKIRMRRKRSSFSESKSSVSAPIGSEMGRPVHPHLHEDNFSLQLPGWHPC